MKKLFAIICLVVLSTTGFSQTDKGESAFVIEGGFNSNPTRLTVGGNWRYTLLDNFRFSADLQYLFPKNRVMGLNVATDLHYTFCLNPGYNSFYVYPLMGVSMLNDRNMGSKKGAAVKTKAKGYTDWGFNLGAGTEYYFSNSMFLNTELKYIFSDTDSFCWTLGLGFKF